MSFRPHPNRPHPIPSPEGEGLLFAQSALRLCGLSALLLGWRPGEFWAATPTELQVIFGAMAGTDNEQAPPAPSDMAKLREMFPDG